MGIRATIDVESAEYEITLNGVVPLSVTVAPSSNRVPVIVMSTGKPTQSTVEGVIAVIVGLSTVEIATSMVVIAGPKLPVPWPAPSLIPGKI